jgi:endoglucanase
MRAIACMALLLCLALPASAEAGRANAGVGGAGNPLEGVRFPAYVPPTRDPAYDALAAYQATDPAPELAAVLAKPRFRWFGPWVPNTVIKRTVRDFIGAVQQGDAEAGVQIAAFTLVPWGDAACRKLPSLGQRRAYGRWIHELQYAVGRTRAVVVLQPDMPFVRCIPRRSSWAVEDVAWAARELAELERTTVYIDAGAADWVPVNQVADILRRAGIRHVRGFALNVTRFDSTRRQLDYGRRLLNRLKRFGIHRKGFIVNTAQNGRPFTPQSALATSRSGRTCVDDLDSRCVAFGQPPTTRTGFRGADALLWVGRPALDGLRLRGRDELIGMIRSSPYF